MENKNQHLNQRISLFTIAKSSLTTDTDALLEYLHLPETFSPEADVQASLALLALWRNNFQLSESFVSNLIRDLTYKELATQVALTYARIYPTALHELLKQEQAVDVLEAACFSAGELQDAEFRTQLEHLAVHHPDDLVRESAIAALGSIGAPESLAIVLRGLEDKVYIRRRAVVALAAFEGPMADQALHKATSDRDFQVRSIAEDLLRQ